MEIFAQVAFGFPCTESQTIGQCVSDIYTWSLSIVGILAFLQILFAGVQILTAAGNASKIGEARGKITNAVLGIILLFSSYLILFTINPDLVGGSFNLPNLGGQTTIERDLDNIKEGGACNNDGVADFGEYCDGSDLDNYTCASFGTFVGGVLSCTSDCSFNTLNCKRTVEDDPPNGVNSLCNNGTKEAGEFCDQADLDGKTCQSLGFTGGTLSCRNDCAFSTLDCEGRTGGGDPSNGGNGPKPTPVGGGPGSPGSVIVRIVGVPSGQGTQANPINVTRQDSFSLAIDDANNPGQASGSNPQTTFPTSSVQVQCFGCNGPNPQITAINWSNWSDDVPMLLIVRSSLGVDATDPNTVYTANNSTTINVWWVKPGGGANGGGGNKEPVINSVSIPSTVSPGSTVNMSADVSDPDNDPLTFTWTQLTVGSFCKNAPGISISGLTSLNASFIAPSTTSNEGNYKICIRFSANDGNGPSASLITQITVE